MSELPQQNVNLTPAASALFYATHFGTWPASRLPATAAGELYNVGRATTADCESALADCLARGWLQVIDEAALAAIIKDVRAAGLIGPIYGLPELGDADFTPVGAAIWLSGSGSPDPSEPPFAYQVQIEAHGKSSHYFRTKAAALALINKIQGDDAVGSISGPFQIGPWRAQWWRRFLDGYRIDLEWHGYCPSGNHYGLARLARCGGIHCSEQRPQADLQRLQHILDCHNVTLSQWLLLEAMDSNWMTYTSRLSRIVSDSASKRFGRTISEAECRTALQECLRHGWLMIVDFDTSDTVRRETIARLDELEALLRDEPAIMPIAPEGWPLNSINFMPSGAALYRMLAAEWLGPTWEDEIQVCVSTETYREEHRYCETEEGLRAVLQECADRQENVRTSKIVPIGPWCVQWWKRFPRGYRLELQVGDPCAIGQTDSNPVRD